MTSPTNTAGLEVVRIVACHLPIDDCPDTVCLPITITAGDLRTVYAALFAAASAQARIAELTEDRDEWRGWYRKACDEIAVEKDRAQAAEARADRLARALAPFVAEHACDGHATVEDFNMEVQILVRWSLIKAARAALQDQPK